MLPVDFPRRFQELLVVRWWQQSNAADHVEANSGVGVVVDVGDDGRDGFEFEEEVHSVGFTIVSEEERNEAKT